MNFDEISLFSCVDATPRRGTVRQAIYAQSKHFYDCAVTIPIVEPFPKVVRGRYRWFIIIAFASPPTELRNPERSYGTPGQSYGTPRGVTGPAGAR